MLKITNKSIILIILFFRILEFEIENLEMTGGGTETIEVELWDCSGNQRYNFILSVY